MSNRFVTAVHNQSCYGPVRVNRMINEADFEPHRMRPYGYETGKFHYRSMWEVHQTRSGNRFVKRMVKKAARMRAKQELRREEE